MPSPETDQKIMVLVGHPQTREFLLKFLEAQDYHPRLLNTQKDLIRALKELDFCTIFVDCQVIELYGPGLFAKIKVACPACRMVLLCDRTHEAHRDLVKEAMDLGVYACLLAPFAEWEILTMIRPGQVTAPAGRPSVRDREKS
jgi:DNA-binding NtrC family response regulator